jgi:putative (di)nucleoside polyphosphate hydrolase
MSTPHFRAGVVIVVRRSDGYVLAFERADVAGEWQLPQGGLEAGEDPGSAAWRELGEETGLGPDDVRLTGEYDGYTVYAWPIEMRRNGRVGQVHRWFFFEPRHDLIEPRPDGREFVAWSWMWPDELIDQVVEFRRGPYRQVLGG